jgi:3-hydroxy-9,10-secoandrosta-1,3,5(10)-triene-9,17-dione monooxygenase reductase component
MAVDQTPVAVCRFRRALSHFCSGVVVVTADHGGTPVGLTCQSFAALSLEPPLVMFGAAATSTSWPRVRAAGWFAVNILSEQQEATSRMFAMSGGDKFCGVAWRPGIHGQPLIEGALAHVQCRLHAVHPGGDHDIVVGQVLALQEFAAASGPLLYFRSEYRVLPRATATPVCPV